MDNHSILYTIENLLDKLHSMTDDKLSIGEIIRFTKGTSLGFILLLFAAPMALPIPVPPGINIILASPLIFLTIQMAGGRHKPSIPAFITKKKINTENFKKTLEKLLQKLTKLSKFSKPRLIFMYSQIGYRLTGLFALIMALTVCIPLPGTNTVPSFGLCLIALGMMTRDGILTLCGLAIGIIWIVALCVAGFIFGDTITEWIANIWR